MNRLPLLAAALSFAVLVTSPNKAAEPIVTGSPSDVVINADGKTVEEVLKALNGPFGLKYYTGVPLDHRLQGSYHGTLDKVIPELLAEYDFTISEPKGAVEIRISGLSDTSGPRQAPYAKVAPVQTASESTSPETAQSAPSGGKLTGADHKKIFGADAPPVQMSDAFIRAYAARALRGNTRRNPGLFPILEGDSGQ